MRVTVDADVCEGHGLCEATAPDVFELVDDGDHAVVITPRPSPERRPDVEAAAWRCPKQAITVHDEN